MRFAIFSLAALLLAAVFARVEADAAAEAQLAAKLDGDEALRTRRGVDHDTLALLGHGGSSDSSSSSSSSSSDEDDDAETRSRLMDQIGLLLARLQQCKSRNNNGCPWYGGCCGGYWPCYGPCYKEGAAQELLRSAGVETTTHAEADE